MERARPASDTGLGSPFASRDANGKPATDRAPRYAVSLLDLNAAWQAPAGAALVEAAVEDREKADAVVVEVADEEALVLAGRHDHVVTLATALAGFPLPGGGGRTVRVYAERPEGWRRVPAPPAPRRRGTRRRGSRQGARVARRGAVPGAVPPVAEPAPAATAGHGARPGADGIASTDGATLADGEAATGGMPVSSCGNEAYVPGAQSRACAREIREGGVPPLQVGEGACPHPQDAREQDAFEAGHTRCLACGATWESRS